MKTKGTKNETAQVVIGDFSRSLLPEYKTFVLKDVTDDKDFEVTSLFIMDEDCNEYFSFEHFIVAKELEFVKQNEKQLSDEEYSKESNQYFERCLEEACIHPDIFDTKIVVSCPELDEEVAKLCGFGVLKMLTGERRGQSLLFPVMTADDTDLHFMLLAYHILMTENVPDVWVPFLNNPDFRMQMMMTIGRTAFERVEVFC